jgi:CBS domain-containing protein
LAGVFFRANEFNALYTKRLRYFRSVRDVRPVPKRTDRRRYDDGQSAYLLSIQFYSENKCAVSGGRLRAVLVVDVGRPIGILTDHDMYLASIPDCGSQYMAAFTNSDVVSIGPCSSLAELATSFGRHSVQRLLVIDRAG